MRKIGLLCGIVLLVGCSAIMEKISFDLLSETNVWKPDSSARINSCKQLKTESFDIFYFPSNQNCLKKYGDRLKIQFKEMNENGSDTPSLDFINEFIQNQQKYDECRMTKDLRIGNGWMYLKYFEKLYNICKSSDYFKESEVNQIISDYKAIDSFKRSLPKQQDLQSKQYLAQREASFKLKLQGLLSRVNTDPVLKKFKQNAPDFMMAGIGGDDSCPLVLFFDIMHNKASAFHSDLAFPKNYKFIRKNADVLKVFIGDFEFTFVKNQKNSVNATFIQMIDPEGDAIISKNTAENNFTLQLLCNL